MPKCYGCERPASSDDLRSFGENNRGWPKDELGCSRCRRKRLTQVVSRLPKREAEEKTMAKKETSGEQKPILSVQVFEVDKNEDGESNFRVDVSAKLGGLTLSFDRTTDQIRDYFTAKRQRSMAKKLAKGERKLKAVTTDED